MHETGHQLAAIMFTDIVGYTALMGRDSSKALKLMRLSKEIQQPLVEKHHGKWIKELGDGILVQFNSALNAVNCALEIQALVKLRFEGQLRIGINLGDITMENNDVYGDGVNLASRIQEITDPGGIYISESVEKSIRGQLTIETKFLGELQLKNVNYGVRTYALQGQGLPIPKTKLKLKGHGLSNIAWIFIITAFLIISIPLYFLAVNNYQQGSTNNTKRIAVLPFKNLNNNQDTQYWVDGFWDVVMANLATIGELDIVSRTSMEQYRDSNAPVNEIAQEVGATHIVEGSVQRIGDQIRVVIQLIDAERDSHLWAKTFDVKWENSFKLESELSLAIAEKLNTQVTDPERKIIHADDIVNPLAQDFLFKAFQVQGRGFEYESIELKRQLIRSAIELDSSYIEGWRSLAHTEMQIFSFGFDRTIAQKKRINEAMHNALALGPDIPDVQYTHARYLYQVEKDFSSALLIFEQLNHTNYIGLTHRRLGNFEKAAEKFTELTKTDPDWDVVWYNLGSTLQLLGRYQQAKKAFEKVIYLSPGFDDVYPDLAMVEIAISGDLGKARAIWNQEFLRTNRWLDFAYFEVLERNFSQAIEIWQTSPTEGAIRQTEITPKSLGMALIYYLAQNDSSQVLFRKSINPLLTKLEETSNDWRIYASLGLVYAGLNDKEKALEAISHLVDIEDALNKKLMHHKLVRIYIILGEFDLALEIIRENLNKDAFYSINHLKLHPQFDPLRSHPEFQAILDNT